MKIITFTKNNQFQALLQFSDPVNAQQAKLVGSHTDEMIAVLILNKVVERNLFWSPQSAGHSLSLELRSTRG